MTRPVVAKRDSRWIWECRQTCARGAKGFPTRDAALTALLEHLRSHGSFGFQVKR